jgi:hypothetical protein
MNPDQRRQFNTSFGGVLLALGIIAWLLTIYFAAFPRAEVPALRNATSVDLSSCRSALGDLGYTATERPNEVSAFEPLSDDPQGQLEKASIAANLCHLKMHTFCIGEGCEKPGITLVLRKPVELAVEKASAVAPSKPNAKP